MMKTFYDEESMINFGEKLVSYLFPNALMTLTGDLGAGKTTFTKGIGKGLNIKKVINSPTFTIVKVYHGDLSLYHFDAYRLEDNDNELGFEEMFEAGGISVIEWPQFIEDILPEERLDIEILKNEDQSRTFVFHPKGKVYEDIVKEIEND